MSRIVTVVDYGRGNLFSVEQALEHCGAETRFATTGAAVAEAEILLLPGVGAFGDGIGSLRECGLIEPIRAHAAAGKLLLGICLGMQLLFDESEEYGLHSGLGLIPGRVVAIPDHAADGGALRVPHVGWNDLVPPSGGRDWAGSILDKIHHGASVYFVHSFHAVCARDQDRLADCHYGGQRLSVAVAAGNVVGCQFHPERSGPVGLRILRNFIDGAP